MATGTSRPVLAAPAPSRAPAAAPGASATARRTRRTGRAAVRLGLSGGAAVAILAVALPRIAHEDWGAIGRTLASVGPGALVLLSTVWLLGLWAHTPALTAAMPGLSHRRALELNLTGSFVSNLLPLGGAAGTVANWRMARTWGFTSADFARWAILTNVIDTAVKLVLPGVALSWLALAGIGIHGTVLMTALAGLGLLALLVVVGWLLGRDDSAVRGIGRVADRLGRQIRWLPTPRTSCAERAVVVRRQCVGLVARGWPAMVGGKLAYAALQAVLLWLSLRALGTDLPPAVVLAAYAVERVLSMAVITPSGTGIVEAGVAGALVALHTAPGVAVAGVLLYRAFVVGMEIPVGGAWLAGWAARQGARAAQPVPGVRAPEARPAQAGSAETGMLRRAARSGRALST